MDFNKIEEYLRSGGTAEEIAEAFTTELNKVISTLSHEKEIQDKAVIAANAWNEFINIYVKDHPLPNNIDVYDFYVGPSSMIELAETIVKLTPFIVKYASVLENISDGAEDLSNKFQNKISENLNDFDFKNVIDTFLGKANI